MSIRPYVCLAFVSFIAIGGAAPTGRAQSITSTSWLPTEPIPLRRNEDGFRALFTIDRTGENVKFLTAAPGRISSATPEWSHDGTRVAFDAVKELHQFSASELFIFHVEGAHAGKTQNLGHGNVPTWSPDDEYLAFMLNPGNPLNDKGGIWLMRSDGSDRVFVAEGWYPRWSPRGDQLCIQNVTARPRRLTIYDIATDTHRHLLGQTWSVQYSGATWSPDGTQLVFVGEFQGEQHIATCRVDGDESSVQILFTPDNRTLRLIGPPSWSPDGTTVVFAMQDTNRPNPDNRQWANSRLYLLDVAKQGEVRALEKKALGLINRGMNWSRDGRSIIFSSERPVGEAVCHRLRTTRPVRQSPRETHVPVSLRTPHSHSES